MAKAQCLITLYQLLCTTYQRKFLGCVNLLVNKPDSSFGWFGFNLYLGLGLPGSLHPDLSSSEMLGWRHLLGRPSTIDCLPHQLTVPSKLTQPLRRKLASIKRNKTHSLVTLQCITKIQCVTTLWWKKKKRSARLHKIEILPLSGLFIFSFAGQTRLARPK